MEFRSELYACMVSRSDALFELCDALLCSEGPVLTLVDLALAPEHRRGHGALYSGLNRGRIGVARLRRPDRGASAQDRGRPPGVGGGRIPVAAAGC
ncbi:transposase [Streptomyces sp. NPDC091259]|uniref:transposase n=1 Tax=Streptomyces sp. NPDC091259 TaxID=3365976 RepID=UPI003823EADE